MEATKPKNKNTYMQNDNNTRGLNKEWLSRIDLDIHLDELISKVAHKFQLGEVLNWQPIEEGLDDCNVRLETRLGKYVVKIFSKGKPSRIISDNVKALLKLHDSDIPVPQLVPFGNDNHIYNVQGKNHKTKLCVTTYFQGNSLALHPITDTDVRTVAMYLARFHLLPFKVHRNYDSWGTTNLLNEFKRKKQFLPKSDFELIAPTVEEFSKVDIGKFKKSVIHGDLQRAHVLKDQNQYCILDLGCMDFNARVIDLAIFLALFCSDDQSYAKNYMRIALDEYQSHSLPLSKHEVSFLPLAIRATYCAYLLASNSSLANGHTTTQIQSWNSFSRRNLKLFADRSPF